MEDGRLFARIERVSFANSFFIPPLLIRRPNSKMMRAFRLAAIVFFPLKTELAPGLEDPPWSLLIMI